MGKFKSLACLILAACMLLSGCAAISPAMSGEREQSAAAEEQLTTTGTDALPYQPVKKPGGGKFTIGFLDLDPYPYTAMMLYDVVEGLKADGWISYDALPFEREDTDAKELVAWLAKQDLGPYLEFSKEVNFYTLVDDEAEIRASLAKHSAARDIDVVLAWATGPAQLAKEYSDGFCVIAYPISDPVGSGIVKDIEYSAVKNVWAHTDTERYPRQMRVFHEVYAFNNIGVIYYDATMAALEDYLTGAESVGAKVSSRQIPTLGEDETAYYTAFMNALNSLIDTDGIDAFLLTTDMMKDDYYLELMVQQCNQAGVPIFVQSGDQFVEAGCLMTVQIIDSQDVGRFVANTIGKTLNGARPEELLQLYVSTPYLVLNFDACKKLNIDLPFEMLISCEKIYREGNGR